MELTPKSARSPTPPRGYASSHQQVYDYPSPAQSDSRYQSTDSLQGSGLYSCPNSDAENGGTNIPSPPATNPWPTENLQNLDTPGTAQSTPSILSAEYDPFAPFHPALSAGYSNDIYSAYPAEVSLLSGSPLPSGNTSQRSSFSSALTSEMFSQAISSHLYTSRVKIEGHPDYVSGHEGLLISSPQLNHSILGTSNSSYPRSLGFYHAQTSMVWPRVDYTSQELPSIASLPLPRHGRRSERQERTHDTRLPSTVVRARQPRKLTTKEDANFQCNVKGCGKLFGRSYNFKAHMETHDAGREYPFPCTMKECNRKFVRKTDLQRHQQSVHMKQRNHKCDYCSRLFARKDTLRRHMEDGCSKRFDIETMEVQSEGYGNGDQHSVSM